MVHHFEVKKGKTRDFSPLIERVLAGVASLGRASLHLFRCPKPFPGFNYDNFWKQIGNMGHSGQITSWYYDFNNKKKFRQLDFGALKLVQRKGPFF